MPRYDFQCCACSYTFEEEHPFGERQTPVCSQCGGVTEKLIPPPNIHFKGDGFYNTDRAKKVPEQKEVKKEAIKAEKPQKEAKEKDSPKESK